MSDARACCSRGRHFDTHFSSKPTTHWRQQVDTCVQNGSSHGGCKNVRQTQGRILTNDTHTIWGPTILGHGSLCTSLSSSPTSNKNRLVQWYRELRFPLQVAKSLLTTNAQTYRFCARPSFLTSPRAQKPTPRCCGRQMRCITQAEVVKAHSASATAEHIGLKCLRLLPNTPKVWTNIAQLLTKREACQVVLSCNHDRMLQMRDWKQQATHDLLYHTGKTSVKK
eukprot:5973040-Amphidinium_carterae.1